MKKLNKPTNPNNPSTSSCAASMGLPPHSINFYGALQEAGGTLEEEDARLKEEKLKKLLITRPSFSYTPGMIVKVKFLVPCQDIKEFKKDMRQYPDVQYVDITEGNPIAFVRLNTLQGTEDLIEAVGTSDIICSKLAGTYEALYWEKIIIDRSNKLSKTIGTENTTETTTTAPTAPTAPPAPPAPPTGPTAPTGPKHVRFSE